MQEQDTSRAKRFAEAGLIVALSLVALVLVRFVLPSLSWREVRPAGEIAVTGTPLPQPTPTLSTPGPGVADILANPPSPGERVEVDAYYSGAGGLALHGGPRPPEDQVLCPMNWSAALTDRPFIAMLSLLNGRRSNVLPGGDAWLVAVTPDQMRPGVRSEPQLPYHARFRGYFGEPAFSECEDTARIFVVEEVVEVYEENPPEVSGEQVLESLATWPRHHDAAWGHSLPYPPDWEMEQLDDRAISIYPPEWPGYAMVVRVHEGETHYDQYDPAAAPHLLQGKDWSVFEQGWVFDGIPGSQHLTGYAAEDDDQPGEQSISVLLSGQGHTYDLSLRYPTGMDTQQFLVTAYTLMVEGFRLDQLPAPSPTPPVKQELGEGPFLSQEEVLRLLRERHDEDIELLGARLVAEAEARQGVGPCATFAGHPEGIWLLRVRIVSEGERRSMLLLVDATTGEQLCGEEMEWSDASVATETPGAPITWATHRDGEIGYALDYPADWYVRGGSGAVAVLTSFEPDEAGHGGIAADQTKIDILVVDEVPEDQSELQALQDLIDEAETEASRVVRQEQWPLAGDLPATRLQIESESVGEVALLLTVMHGRDLVLAGYGDLTRFDEIACTLRPLSVEQAPTATPVDRSGVLPDPGNAPPFAEYGEFICTYLAVGGSVESLAERLQSWGAITDGAGLVRDDVDLNGDGVNDVVIMALVPEADPAFTPSLMPAGGLFVYVSASATAGTGQFDLAYEDLPGSGYSYPRIVSLDDLDGDGRNDLLYTVQNCGAHTCFAELKGVRWVAAKHLESLFVDPIEATDAEFRVVGSEMRGAYEIVVQVGMIGSVGAGPQRTFEHTYRWDGAHYVLAEERVTSGQHPIHLINDADALLAQGKYAEALALYVQSYQDETLDRDWAAYEGWERALEAYARYRSMLAQVAVGDDRGAESTYKALQADYADSVLPGSVFAGYAQSFWEAYCQHGDLQRACEAVRAAVGADDSGLSLLNQFGYANKNYSAEEMCALP